MNAGEDVLVFYNDNKASFQQFVEMMRKERDRQYREDMQILAAISRDFGETVDLVMQNKDKLADGGVIKTVTAEDSPQQDGVAEKIEDENNNGRDALRFDYLSLVNVITIKNKLIILNNIYVFMI